MLQRAYNIGFVSHMLASVGLQERLLDEGHKVTAFIAGINRYELKDSSGLKFLYPRTYKLANEGRKYRGLSKSLHADVKKDLYDFVKGKDFIVCDYNGKQMGMVADYLRSIHPYVMGPTAFTNKLELDRAFGKTLAEAHGFALNHEGVFVKTIEDARKLLKKHPTKNFLLKGTWDTVLPPNRADCQDFLEQDYFTFFRREKGVFMEEQIVGGEEFSYDCWFDGQKFWPYCFINREYKGVNNENRGGVFSGESGTAGQLVPFDQLPQRVQSFFASITADLKDSEYRGFFGINTIMVGDKLHFLEFTTRFGYPTEHIISTMVHYARFLAHLSGFEPLEAGNNAIVEDDADFSVSIGLLHYDSFVGQKAGKMLGLVHGLDKLSNSVHKRLFDAGYLDKKRTVRIVQQDRAVILTCNAFSVDDAREELYDEAKKVSCWSHTYRDDVGLDLIKLIGYNTDLATVLRKSLDVKRY